MGLKKPKTCWRNTWMLPNLAASIKMHFMVSLIRETYRQLKWIPPYNGVVKNLTTPKYYRGYSLSFECPKLWRIIKHSLHNEMIYKVNCTAIFFFDSNYFKLLISRPSAVCKNESFENWLFCSVIIFGAKIVVSVIYWVEKIEN